MGWELEVLGTIDYSTNDYIKNLAKCGGANAHAVLALCQKGGRGRHGRSWESGSAGEGVALSLYARLHVPTEAVSFVTLISALAVRDGVTRVCGITPDIKYPNDLLISGKKLCGILTELIGTDGGYCELVIGIGLNLNQKEFNGELKAAASSVYLECGRTFAAEIVAEEILTCLDIRLSRFEREGYKGQRDEYEAAMTVREGELESYDDIIKERDMDISGKKVLCGANSYVEKYYFNPEHTALPEAVQKELRSMCVLFTEEIGGILTVGFNDDGSIELVPDHEAADYFYDEIEAQLKVRTLYEAHGELFGQLARYYNLIVKAK